ncbi:twin-arginine translocation signal domain-containing protein, partial [Rhizobium ruizarguesonis]
MNAWSVVSWRRRRSGDVDRSTGRNSMTFLKQFPSTTRRRFLKGEGLVSAAAFTGSFPIPAI